MHGTVFPPLEIGEVLSTVHFLEILSAIFLILTVLNRLLPHIVSASLMKGLAVLGGIIVSWELISFYEIINPVLLPPPSRVVSLMAHLWSIGFLQTQIYSTVYKITYAFTLALVSGVTIGIMISYFSNTFSFLESFLNAIRVVPAPAWLALAILWFGIGHASAIFIIWLGIFFPILLSAVAGVAKVEQVQVETVLTFGGDKYDVLLEVVLPVIYHHVLTGARIGIGIGWITVVTAELVSVSANSGLGWMINDSRILLDITTVMVGMFLIGFLGIVSDAIINRFEGLVPGWD
ncbi:MAG TPA: ABC transporter permease [Nitrospirae bacterium]|nr:ABC transporter permease [Nitrospirota bacterium]